MKGQTQAVTAVMITGIMVGTIAAVYVWGSPLLEKREGQAELEQAESDVISLMNSVESTANSGEGASSEVDLRISDGEVFVNETGNYIEVVTLVEGQPYPMNTWSIIEGNNLQGLSFGAGDFGIKGQDSAGIVAAQSTDAGGTTRIEYRVEFRNLLDDDLLEFEKIDFNVAGSESATGEVTVEATNQGVETDTFELENEEELDREKTEIRVTLS